jgi:hypothetical protein
MSPKVLHAVLVLSLVATAGSIGAAPGLRPEPALVIEGSVVRAAGLEPGDRLFASTPRVLAGIDRRVESAQEDWVDASALGLAPGEVAVVGVERLLPGGTRLQITRAVALGPDGQLTSGPAARTTLRRGLRLTPVAGAQLVGAGLSLDDQGRLKVPGDDPRLGELAARAATIEPYLEAQVQTLADSVSGSNGKDEYFTDHLCGALVYLGTSIHITSAPAGAIVSSMDVSYTVWHSVDISRFRTAMFRMQGGVWGSPIQLYTGGETGSHTWTDTQTGLTSYAGREVNTDYILGCCNRYASESAYLDTWSLTLYYEGSPGTTIDLVADSLGLVSSTVAAGSQAGLFYQGHVGGAGTVGSPFSIGFYLSPDANVTTGDRRLGGVTESYASNPGDVFGNGVVEYVVTVPADVAPGGYTLGMIVDEGGAVTEADEGNNVRTTPITVAASSARPNLHTDSCSVNPTHGAADGMVDFSWSGRNNGTTAAAWFVWGIYLSNDATIDPGSDTGLVGLDVPGGWPAGYTTGTVTEHLALPGGIAPGSQVRIGIALDSGSNVTETNESDNTCAAVYTVDGGAPSSVAWLIPAAASSTGLGGSDWRTQIAAANPTAFTRSVTVHFVAKGAAWPGTTLGGAHTVAPGQSLYLDDLLLPMRPATGLLWLTADGQGMAVTSRTYNLAAGGASFGQGIPAVELPEMAMATTELVLPLVHSRPGRFHTNLGLIQTGSAMTVEVSAYSSGGSLLAVKSYPRSSAWDQITDVFADMGLAGTIVDGGWLRVRLVAGSPGFWTCYASVIDDLTGDPTYVAPVEN